MNSHIQRVSIKSIQQTNWLNDSHFTIVLNWVHINIKNGNQTLQSNAFFHSSSSLNSNTNNTSLCHLFTHIRQEIEMKSLDDHSTCAKIVFLWDWIKEHLNGTLRSYWRKIKFSHQYTFPFEVWAFHPSTSHSLEYKIKIFSFYFTLYCENVQSFFFRRYIFNWSFPHPSFCMFFLFRTISTHLHLNPLKSFQHTLIRKMNEKPNWKILRFACGERKGRKWRKFNQINQNHWTCDFI